METTINRGRLESLAQFARQHGVVDARIVELEPGSYALRVASHAVFRQWRDQPSSACTLIDYVSTRRQLRRLLGY